MTIIENLFYQNVLLVIEKDITDYKIRRIFIKGIQTCNYIHTFLFGWFILFGYCSLEKSLQNFFGLKSYLVSSVSEEKNDLMVNNPSKSNNSYIKKIYCSEFVFLIKGVALVKIILIVLFQIKLQFTIVTFCYS